MEPPFVSIVVPVLNGEETITACLESVLRQDYPADRREILVVDNGSTDRTAEIIRRYPVRYLKEAVRGSGSARNRGVAHARGELVAFLDADCVARPGWLRHAVRAFSDPAVGCVAGEIVPGGGETLARRYAQVRMMHSQRQAIAASFKPFAQTGNALYRRVALEQLGGFDLALRIGEDADLSWRLQQALGFRVVLAPNAVVSHYGPPRIRGLLKQAYGYGRASVDLYVKHRAQMGPRTLKHTYWELPGFCRKLRRVGAATWAAMRRGSFGGSSWEPAALAGLDLCVFLAQKLGQLAGSLRHRVWYVCDNGAG